LHLRCKYIRLIIIPGGFILPGIYQNNNNKMKIIILISVFILSSCSLHIKDAETCFLKSGLDDLWKIFEHKACGKIDTKKQCIILNDYSSDSWILLESWKYTKICGYETKIFTRSISTLPQTIYNLSKSDKDFAQEILEVCMNSRISDPTHLCSNKYIINEVEYLQLYTLLKRAYGYSDSYIMKTFWIEINHSYRFNENTNLDIIFSWENILDKNFDFNEWLPWEVDMLLVIAQAQAEILINLMSANSWIEEPFSYLENIEDKQKYIDLIKLLVSSTKSWNNDFFIEQANNFLDKHN